MDARITADLIPLRRACTSAHGSTARLAPRAAAAQRHLRPAPRAVRRERPGAGSPGSTRSSARSPRRTRGCTCSTCRACSRTGWVTRGVRPPRRRLPLVRCRGRRRCQVARPSSPATVARSAALISRAGAWRARRPRASRRPHPVTRTIDSRMIARRHLGGAVAPVDEGDRVLLDAVPTAHEAQHELGEEGVALRGRRAGVDRPQRRGRGRRGSRRCSRGSAGAGRTTCSGCPNATGPAVAAASAPSRRRARSASRRPRRHRPGCGRSAPGSSPGRARSRRPSTPPRRSPRRCATAKPWR